MAGFTLFLLILLISVISPGQSLSKDFEWTSIGIRGAMNIPAVSLPEGETEDYEQVDVVATLGFPGQWTFGPGWTGRYLINATAGGLRGAGEWGFISTGTLGLAFTKKDWFFTFDMGGGGALLSKWEFGDQDMGGPFQFIAHAGLNFHLPWNMLVGYRFHHMSDGDIYGDHRGVDLHMIEVRYVFSAL